MFSKSEYSIFKSKVFCMNTNRPVEVKNMDHALMEFSIKIKPSEKTIKQHRGYAQRVS